MPIEVDWAKLGELGIGVVALVVFFFMFKLVMGQWSKSTEAQLTSAQALERNTQAYEKLSAVFEKSYERELEFQREALGIMKENSVLLKDTNDRVRDVKRLLERSE